MTSGKDRELCAFGASVLLKHLQALETEMQGVRSGGEDIEYIHRMRVATRRLRAALPLFETCLPARQRPVWLKEIRKITRAMGAARDADVQIAHLQAYASGLKDPLQQRGVARLLLRLRQRRESLQPEVLHALDRFAASGALPAMRAALEPMAAASAGPPFSHALYRHAADSIQPRLDEFLAYDAIVSRPEAVAELHAMRIAAKRLRYTLETFSPLYASGLKPWLPAIRQAQEALGNIHDCDVWGQFIPAFIAEERARVTAFYGNPRPFRRLLPGIEGYLADRAAERQRAYTEFVEQWNAWQRKGFWQQLAEAIRQPLLEAHRLYPPPPAAAAEDEKSGAPPSDGNAPEDASYR